jgi:hypothetical protein
MKPMSLLRLLLVCALLPVAVACGGDEPAPAGEGSPADGGAAAGPTATARAPSSQGGRPLIRSSLSGTCRLTATGAQIRVEYSASASGGTVLTRVRLLENGRPIEDSGEIEQQTYRHAAVYDVDAGDQRTYRLSTESPEGSGANVQTTVRCGTSATPTPAPRA